MGCLDFTAIIVIKIFKKICKYQCIEDIERTKVLDSLVLLIDTILSTQKSKFENPYVFYSRPLFTIKRYVRLHIHKH